MLELDPAHRAQMERAKTELLHIDVGNLLTQVNEKGAVESKKGGEAPKSSERGILDTPRRHGLTEIRGREEEFLQIPEIGLLETHLTRLSTLQLDLDRIEESINTLSDDKPALDILSSHKTILEQEIAITRTKIVTEQLNVASRINEMRQDVKVMLKMQKKDAVVDALVAKLGAAIEDGERLIKLANESMTGGTEWKTPRISSRLAS